MPATLADIQAKYGDSVYPLYKDETHAPYMEEDLIKDPIIAFDNQVAALASFNITQREISKHLKTDHQKVSESIKRSGGIIKEVPEVSVGYKGVVLHDKEEDKILCSECGKWFFSLGKHLNSEHNMTADEYREKHGLYKSVALCSEKYSTQRSEVAQKALTGFSYKKRDSRITGKQQEEEHRKKRLLSSINAKKYKMMTKNRYGLCDAQIAARLLIVRDMAGRRTIEDLTNRDFSKYDINLYQAMRNKYGSFESACKSLGIDYIGQNVYRESELIADLRHFVMKKKRIPLTKRDLGKCGMASYDTYKARFGSYRRAKMMAGLDQLLKEVK